MLFPIADDNLPSENPAFLTWTILAVNVVVYFYQVQHPEFTVGWSVIPYEIVNGVDLVDAGQQPGPTPIYLTLLSSMFMHGGLFHLIGNMLYLWIFADNLEHWFGRGIFLAFYLGCGLVASLVQIALAPDITIPTLGASGAIAGVLGAYLVCFPQSRVRVVLFLWFIIRVISIPAIVVIGVWIAFQLIAGFGSFSPDNLAEGGVAYGAHIGGFAAGALAALILQRVVD